MPQADYIIIDFDSTFISKESLDMLAETCLKRQENYHEIFKKIEQITERGMSGEINFKDSLYQRIRLIKASKKEVVEVSINLKKYLSK